MKTRDASASALPATREKHTVRLAGGPTANIYGGEKTAMFTHLLSCMSLGTPSVAAAATDLEPQRTYAVITEAVKKQFKGGNVLLLADCCHSGGPGVVANNLAAAGFKAASLTSADITVGSTGNWTFIQSILDALNGSVLFDSDNDGFITLKTYEPGKTVTVSWRKEPVAAKVVKQQNGFHLVSYIGWPSDKWVPATIIATDSGNKRYYIHYVGDEAVWDEWVTDNRMKRIDPAA